MSLTLTAAGRQPAHYFLQDQAGLLSANSLGCFALSLEVHVTHTQKALLLYKQGQILNNFSFSQLNYYPVEQSIRLNFQ